MRIPFYTKRRERKMREMAWEEMRRQYICPKHNLPMAPRESGTNIDHYLSLKYKLAAFHSDPRFPGISILGVHTCPECEKAALAENKRNLLALASDEEARLARARTILGFTEETK